MDINIINKIKFKKNDRNLIILDKSNNNNKLNFPNWLSSSLEVYNIYYGKAYNPPFFNNIISMRKNNLEDVQKIWNMTLFNGLIIIFSDHKSYFKDSIILENDKFILIKKNMPITYIFPKYRILEFIIAGTMKGGTTAAIKNFNKHPEINMVEKEIHYYDKKIDYQRGVEWYKSHFNYSKKIVGDKAPDVMYMYSCLELLQISNPQVKIILFLRNPVERAYSHWKMTRDEFGNTNSFEFSIYDELKNRMGENRLYNVAFWHHFIQRGFYYEQIMEILKYFPKDNIFIVISEKVRNNMDEEYQKIFRFLGVSEFHTKFEEDFVSKKKEDVLDKKSKLYKDLKKIFIKDVKKLEKYIGYKTDWW
jgi:hypothetical protein